MKKVFYITSDSADVFYVRAENATAAKELLLEEVGKYVFKRNLSGTKGWDTVDTLGSNIIVEYSVRESVMSSDLSIEDITAAAFIFSKNGLAHWKNWTITEEDVLA